MQDDPSEPIRIPLRNRAGEVVAITVIDAEDGRYLVVCAA